MKKLILICILILTMILPLAVCAEDSVISYLQEETKVTVTGKIAPSMRNENVTLVITRKGINITQESFANPEAKETLELIENISPNARGEWSVVWYPSAVAYYTLKATVNSTGESVESEFYFVEESRRERIENALLSGTLTELETVFADKITLFVLEYSEAEVLKIKDTSKVGRALYYIRQDLTTASDIYNYIDLAMQMVEFNETSEEFAAMTTAMQQYGDIANMAFYNQISVPTVKNQVAVYAAKGILECGLEGYSDLFTDAIVLAGVEKSASYSFLGSYLDLLGNSTYDDATSAIKEKIHLALVGNSYTPQTLASAISSAASPDGGGGGAGGGGSSDGSENGSYKESESGGHSTGMSNVDSISQNTSSSFTDLSSSHWAYVSIKNLCDRQIITGFEDNSFRPDKSLTRAETVTLLCRTFNIDTVSGEAAFDDVKNADWFAEYINAAHKAGFINGEGALFNPNEKITRQDLCVMIYRFAQGRIKNGSSNYADVAEISGYASTAVAALSEAKIINGFEDNTFRPLSNATRAQVAQMLYKYLLSNGI